MANQARRANGQPQPQSSGPEVVNPAWLLRALGIIVVLALLCGYGTFCGLFYFGQWQIVMHPAHGGEAPAQIDGSPVQIFHIEPDEGGTPQLTAWLVPATQGSPYARYTALVLPAADGSLVTQQALLTSLHKIGFALFAIDYRGFGESSSGRPSEAKMHADAEAALRYLTDERHVSVETIIPVGTGLGASVATALAAHRPSLPVLLLFAPDGDTLERVRKDPRVAALPVRALFHDVFPLAEPLKTLATPKLIVSFPGSSLTESVWRTAGSPKQTVEFPGTMATTLDRPEFGASVRGFLDSYLTSGPASNEEESRTKLNLRPSGAPREAENTSRSDRCPRRVS